MKKTVMLLTCVVSAFSLTAQAALPSNAKLSLDKNNIKVWTYKDTNNPVLSYKAETTIDVPIERAVALVLDVNNSPKWVPNVAKAEVLSRDDKKGEFSIYMVLDFPFPLKDRDMVVKGTMSKDASGTIYIKNSAVQQGKALNSDYIRLKDYAGDWTFQKLGPNKVKVITSGHANPEGSIPASVTNMLVEQQPYQMLQKMKSELAKNTKLAALPEILK
ncbi:START domain-containing protein [Acinetobacter bereziniae]|uniref:START domain-containing protein n=1 Tax=Acinetobacter bereziniae TaxID=106648 RepID=UPI0019007A33|nr:START domain-containing protein [Acinetobacter bereziniae]MBJ8551460.1 START domain-containing protein [Acinetobacter bereziniae]